MTYGWCFMDIKYIKIFLPNSLFPFLHSSDWSFIGILFFPKIHLHDFCLFALFLHFYLVLVSVCLLVHVCLFFKEREIRGVEVGGF